MTPAERDRARLAFTVDDLVAAFNTIRDAFAAAFPGQHIEVGAAGGYRTPQFQANVNSAGASVYTGTTTFSKHQRFRTDALDFVVKDSEGRPITDGSDARYRWVGEQFKAAGFKFGGDFQKYEGGHLIAKPDFDHVEKFGPQPTFKEVQLGLELYKRSFLARG